ncbi:involved in de novo 2-like protein [Tanacetum coccineum]
MMKFYQLFYTRTLARWPYGRSHSGHRVPLPMFANRILARQHRVVLAAHGYDGCLSRRSYVFDNQTMTRQKANLEPINGLSGKFVAILEVEIKAHSQKIMYFVGVSESSMFSHFPQRPVGVNRSSHVGSSNRQPSLGDKGHYSEPHGRSMSPDYRFESDVFKQYSNLCVQNTMSRSRETSEGSILSGSSAPNQTTSSKGVDVLSIVNTQAVPSRVLNSPPVVLQATTHAATSGSNQRKRTRANTQAELAVAEGSSLNTRVIDENETERLKGKLRGRCSQSCGSSSGAYITSELWNFAEGRKATLQGRNCLLKLWRTESKESKTATLGTMTSHEDLSPTICICDEEQAEPNHNRRRCGKHLPRRLNKPDKETTQ